MSEYTHDDAMRDFACITGCERFLPSGHTGECRTCTATCTAHMEGGSGAVDRLAAYIGRIEAQQCEADEHIERVESENERLQREVTRLKKDVASLSAQRDRGRNKHHKERNRFLRLQAEAKRIEAERDTAIQQRDELVAQMVEVFGWSDDSYLHASLHFKNAIRSFEAFSDIADERDEWKRVAEWLAEWAAGHAGFKSADEWLARAIEAVRGSHE